MARPKRSIVAATAEATTPPNALEPNQSLVRVVKAEGNNLYLCHLPTKAEILLELAQRFRNTVWIKRGGYVLAQRYPEADQTGRVVGEIVNVVGDEKAWRKQPYWYVSSGLRSPDPMLSLTLSPAGPRSSSRTAASTTRMTRTPPWESCPRPTPKTSVKPATRRITAPFAGSS